MSAVHTNVIDLEAEQRARRGILMGRGRHRRTPESWKAMLRDLTEMQTDRDRLTEERDQARQEAAKLRASSTDMAQEVRAMRRELAHLRALMTPDRDNPVNQTTHVFTMPERPRDEDDPAEVSTHPISVSDLFGDAEPTVPLDIRTMRPVVTVHPIPADDPPMPDHEPRTPDGQAGPRLVQRLRTGFNSASERVQHDTTEMQILNLWDSPQAKTRTDAQRTA
jgi:hypothetical protein